VKDGLDPPADGHDPNLYNEANFNNELINKYIQKFNEEFLTDFHKKIDVNADMYNNVKQAIKDLSTNFGILTKT
jgi:hypothetical protein